MTEVTAFEMSMPDQLDLACALFEHWNVIQEARRGRIALGCRPRREAEAILAIRDAGNVLNDDLTLCPSFRAVLDEMTGGRNGLPPDIEECKRIASRWCDWYAEPLSSKWRMIIYSSRPR